MLDIAIFNAAEAVLRTGLIDRFALDVKSPLTPEAFGKLSGVPDIAEKYTKGILKVIKLCNELNIPIEARTTIAPGVSDGEEYVKEIAHAIKLRRERRKSKI